MSNEENNELYINVLLKNKHLDIFLKIKHRFGFQSNADTLRYLLMRFQELKEAKELTELIIEKIEQLNTQNLNLFHAERIR